MAKKSVIASELQNLGLAKDSKEYRQAYRRLYHERNREQENEKNRLRYHQKYKTDAVWMKKRRESWRRYALKQGLEWMRERGKRYRKPYAQLSQSTRSKIRKAHTAWAKKHWEKRVEYARQHRRKKPGFGLRNKIAKARRTGDIGKLAEECFAAIIRADETSRRR